MSDSDNLIIKRYLDRLKDQTPNIKEVFFFGSRARGTSHKWSDYDICVVSPDFGKDRVAETTKLLMLAADMNENIEPHPMSVEEFNDPNNDFAIQIKRTDSRVL